MSHNVQAPVKATGTLKIYPTLYYILHILLYNGMPLTIVQSSKWRQLFDLFAKTAVSVPNKVYFFTCLLTEVSTKYD